MLNLFSRIENYLALGEVAEQHAPDLANRSNDCYRAVLTAPVPSPRYHPFATC